MKKIILLFVCLLCAVVVRADDEPAATQADNMGCSKVRNFQIFNTGDNILLNLDTRNGRIWMLKVFAVAPEKNNEVVPINETPLVSNDKPGRFWLYKANTTYVLLDKDTGKTWFVNTSPSKKAL